MNATFSGRKGRGPNLPLESGWPSGTYLAPSNFLASTASPISQTALATFLPFVVAVPATVDRIGLYLTAAQLGAECRLGLYSNSNGVPDALLLDAGTLDLSTGAGAFKEIATARLLSPGIYWTCCQMKNLATPVSVYRMAAVTHRLVYGASAANLAQSNTSANRYYSQAIAYGAALPASAGGVVASSGGTDCPVILLRRS